MCRDNNVYTAHLLPGSEPAAPAGNRFDWIAVETNFSQEIDQKASKTAIDVVWKRRPVVLPVDNLITNAVTNR